MSMKIKYLPEMPFEFHLFEPERSLQHFYKKDIFREDILKLGLNKNTFCHFTFFKAMKLFKAF